MGIIILLVIVGISALVGPAITAYYGAWGWLLLIVNAILLGIAARSLGDEF